MQRTAGLKKAVPQTEVMYKLKLTLLAKTHDMSQLIY